MWKDSMHVRTYVRMYVCELMCMCVTKLRVKDGVCESDVSARQCRHFFASAAKSSALHAAALRTWNGLNEVFHDLLCSMWCNEMCYVTAAPVLQPWIRRWWHRGKVPGRKSVEHECSWLSMQLCPSVPLSAMSATPATQNEGRCEIVKCRGVTGVTGD